MSEQARRVYLQEAIKETKRRKISGWIEFIIGTGLMGVGLFLIDPPLSYWLLFGGLFLAILGFYSINVNVRKESLLRKELSLMPKVTSKCLSCGKEIPQGNFDFCPFCGNSLKKEDLGSAR
jgi:hypothetical protein